MELMLLNEQATHYICFALNVTTEQLPLVIRHPATMCSGNFTPAVGAGFLGEPLHDQRPDGAHAAWHQRMLRSRHNRSLSADDVTVSEHRRLEAGWHQPAVQRLLAGQGFYT